MEQCASAETDNGNNASRTVGKRPLQLVYSTQQKKGDTSQLYRVLIIEKGTDLAWMLHATLQDHIQCDHVAEMDLALDNLCSQSLPRIIVADLSVLTEPWRNKMKKLMLQGFFGAMPLIFVMDETDDEKWRWELLQAGALDVLVKPVSEKMLTAKIHALINLQISIEESVVQSMQSAVHEMMKSGHLLHEKLTACRRYERLQSRYNLSFSEMKIVKLIDQGLVHKEIGEKLKLSENTVKNTAHQIYQKCYVNSKAELVELLHKGT